MRQLCLLVTVGGDSYKHDMSVKQNSTCRHGLEPFQTRYDVSGTTVTAQRTACPNPQHHAEDWERHPYADRHRSCRSAANICMNQRGVILSRIAEGVLQAHLPKHHLNVTGAVGGGGELMVVLPNTAGFGEW